MLFVSTPLLYFIHAGLVGWLAVVDWMMNCGRRSIYLREFKRRGIKKNT